MISKRRSYYLIWSAQHRADLEELIHLATPREERTKGVELGHDAAHGPQVDGTAVVGGVQEYLRCAVPTRRYVVRKRRPRSDLLARPKSAILMRSGPEQSKFSGFRSRWKNP